MTSDEVSHLSVVEGACCRHQLLFDEPAVLSAPLFASSLVAQAPAQ